MDTSCQFFRTLCSRVVFCVSVLRPPHGWYSDQLRQWASGQLLKTLASEDV